MSNEVTFIRVRRKQDIVNKYKPDIKGKIVFIAESTTPELTEIKLSEDIRDLKLFESDSSYDVITGSKTSIKNKLKIKGYVKKKEDRRKKEYKVFTRLICHCCEAIISETGKRINTQTFKSLSKDHSVSGSNVVIINNTGKCRFC